MGKVLLVMAVIVTVLWLMSLLKRERFGQHKATRASAAPRLTSMVACAHCGVHVPESDAAMRDGLPYCCEAHRDLGPKSRVNVP